MTSSALISLRSIDWLRLGTRVLIIEHNVHVMAAADWIIGPRP